MKRLVVALAALFAAFPAVASADRTDDTAKPVVFVSGGETSVDCKAFWKPMQSRIRELRIVADGKIQRFKTTPFVNVSTHAGDSNCEFNLGVGDDQGVEAHARALADWLKRTFGPTGESFDAVAAGTGGVVLRAALALEPTLRLEDAVTLNAPHAGARFDGCARKVCSDLTTGSAFLGKLAGWANPQGANGTDWTVIGSAADKLVSAASALAMDAEHKTTYLSDYPKQVLTHTSLISNTTSGNTARITYSHRGTAVFEWRKAPWPAERVGMDLVMGAGASQGTGTGASNCTGFNDAGGAVVVEDPGLAVWNGNPRQVSFIRTGILEAYSDCFVKFSDDVYTSATTVRLNGIEIRPEDSNLVAIDVKKRQVRSAKMSMAIPSSYFDRIAIPLAQHDRLDWTLPKEAGTLSASDIDGFGATGKAKLFGLPLKGLHKLSLGQGFTSLEVNIGIPGIFSGSTPTGGAYAEKPQCANGKDDDRDGKVDFPADSDCKDPTDNYESAADGPGFIGSVRSDNKKGLQVDKLGGTIEGNLGLGKLRIGSASFWYSLAENEWSATLSATVPILQRAPDVKVGVGVKDGSLKYLSGEVTNIGAGPFAGGLYWQRVKIGYTWQPARELALGLGVSWGPRIYTAKGALSLVDVDGDLTLNDLGFKLSGSLSLLGDVWGKGSLEYKSGTGVTTSAELGKDWSFETADKKNSLKAELKGTFNGTFNSGSVDLSAKAGLCFAGKLAFGPIATEVSSTCLAQAQARLSANDKALAVSACGQIDLGLWTGSIGYARKMGILNGLPGSKAEWIGNSCDFAAWHTSASASQVGSPGVSLGSGLEATVIGVVGQGGAPRIALKGPGGAVVPAAVGDSIVRGDGYVVIPSTGENTTYVVLARPKAGRWTVEPAAGSAPVVSVKSAEALPEPSVTAKVHGKRISYTVKQIPGQTVRLREVGPNVSAPLGTLRGSKGTLRFKPAFGRGGKRRIVADVLHNDAPRTSLTVAHYKAPALKKLSAPKRVRVTPVGAVAWSAVRGATGYTVSVWTTDGRALTYDATSRRVKVRNLAGHSIERVVVRAVRADGAPGRPKAVRP